MDLCTREDIQKLRMGNYDSYGQPHADAGSMVLQNECTCLCVLCVIQVHGPVGGGNSGKQVVIGWMPAGPFQPALGSYQQDRV